MDSFLLLRRLVAAIVFKGQTVSDYWWSRRTIFLTHCLRSSSPRSDESRVFSEIRYPSVRSYGDLKYYRPCLEFFFCVRQPTVKCSHHRGYEPEGTAPSVLRSYHVRSPMTFVCSGARHVRDFSFLPKRHQITPYFVGVDLSTMPHSESDHSQVK